MIRVRASLSDDGHFHLTVDGHTDSADGRVCAAVTAITQTCLLGLEEYSAHHPDQIDLVISQEESKT